MAALIALGNRRLGNTPETVDLQLTPRNAALLAQTAAEAQVLAPVVRDARAAEAIAGTGRATEVADRARALGFTVLTTTDTHVLLRGSAALVHADFGSARDNHPTFVIAQPLPKIPATLASLVTEATGGDETRPAMLPLDSSDPTDGSLSVDELHSMYDVTASSTPPDAESPTIATLQFANWTSSNLATYVSDNDIYGSNPYHESTALTQIGIDGGASGTDGSNEVALDQETLVTVAPQVHQQAYFAPNNGGSQDDMLDAIGDQAAADHIVAVSTSWGACEYETYNGAGDETPDQDAVNYAVAEGVTVFAATGDDGASDCSQDDTDSATDVPYDSVDSPASLPNVVAVGGTMGTDVSQLSTWDNPAIGSGGGGYSCLNARPAYQAAKVPAASFPDIAPYCTTTFDSTGAPLTGYATRAVPDISADAGDGLDVIDTTADVTNNVCLTLNPCQLLGTSFAVQIAASSWAQTLTNYGYTRGVDGIDNGAARFAAALYALPTGFHDVVHGNNDNYYASGQQVLSYDNGYGATSGWDAATGLGSPDFGSIGSQLLTSAGSTRDDYAINVVGTRTGNVELTAFAGSEGMGAESRNTVTALQVTNASQWEFFMGPYNGDGREDLYAVRLNGGGSGDVEVHVLSQASNYQTFLLHRATPLPQVSRNQWQVAISPFKNDGQSDLIAVHYINTSSHNVEVHVLGAASSYTSYLLHAVTPLAQAASSWDYLAGDASHDGNLVAVLWNTGSANVQVHILSATSNYHTFTLHALSGLNDVNGNDQFSLVDYNGDGVPDLMLTKFNQTGSGDTEVHILNGANSFHTFLLHAVTPMPEVNAGDWAAASQP